MNDLSSVGGKDYHINVRLLDYGMLIIQWKLDISVKSAPNPTYISIMEL